MSPRLRRHEIADRSRNPDDAQRERLVAELQEAIAAAVNARPRLERAAHDLGGEFASGGDSGQSDDDEAVTGSITERRAIEGMRNDVERATSALAHLRETIGHIRRLGIEVRQCLPVSSANTTLAGCKSCSRLTDSQGSATFSAQHRGELCSWCYDFERLWRSWPPVELVDLHSRGIKISERRVKEALSSARR